MVDLDSYSSAGSSYSAVFQKQAGIWCYGIRNGFPPLSGHYLLIYFQATIEMELVGTDSLERIKKARWKGGIRNF